MNLDIEGFSESHDLLVNKAQIVQENEDLSQRLIHVIKFEDARFVKEENDVLRNQLNYYMENSLSKATEQKDIKEVFTQHKNLGFFSEMLVRERESLLNQLEM